MQEEFLTERIRKFLGERFPRTQNLNQDDLLLGNGLLDSLGILEVVNFLEQEFKIMIHDEDLLPENFQSVHRLVAFVIRKLNQSLHLQG